MADDYGNLEEERAALSEYVPANPAEAGQIERQLRDLDRRITICLADDLADPLVRHARCSNMYSYSDMDVWFHTPLMAAQARLKL